MSVVVVVVDDLMVEDATGHSQCARKEWEVWTTGVFLGRCLAVQWQALAAVLCWIWCLC
jgi:hypothetical protein